MKDYKNSTMGLEVTLKVPDSNEEFDKLAGRTNAANEDAVKYNVLHGWNTEFRSAFVEAVEKDTKVAILVDQAKTDKAPKKKDGSVTNVMENDLVYFRRVLAETQRTAISFQPLAQQVADSIPLQLSETARAGRIGKEYTSAAEELVSKAAAGTVDLSKVVANLERLNPGLTIEIDPETSQPTVEGLAKGIKANSDRKRAEDMQELAA